ncbi:hypothetical protein OPT61_g7404 [Boeremia exigua]|uniref:Uncharacterized protein n=1 Tax=Boeremia exigua TaxID=749465 RepID=A0ACC2I2X2_9PLEO|nr:hypothetical protein OPT61_g7404 [Boeremia exigua]
MSLSSKQTEHTGVLLAVERSTPTLLNISGEIRNHIYDFAAEEDTVVFEDTYCSEDKVPPRDKPKFLALTQVCREIRGEFAPLYKARTTICVPASKANSIVENFYKSSQANDEDVVGKLVIDFSIQYADAVNVKAILQLAYKAKGFSVILTRIDTCGEEFYNHESLQSFVDTRLGVVNPTLFRAYLDQAIYDVRLESYNTRSGGCTTVTIRKDHWKPFERFFTQGTTESDLRPHPGWKQYQSSVQTQPPRAYNQSEQNQPLDLDIRLHAKPEHLYEYIDTFLATPGVGDEQLVGSIILDVIGSMHPCTASCLDIKPLLLLLRRAKGLYVGAEDILGGEGVDCESCPATSIQGILKELYDIVDMDAFYDYVDKAMSVLEVEHDDMRGVEIVFELRTEFWEDWMGVWISNSGHPDTDSQPGLKGAGDWDTLMLASCLKQCLVGLILELPRPIEAKITVAQ